MTAPASTPSIPPPPVSPSALRLVLFGMPDAGKSSLLGALTQASQVQERTLRGRLTDLWHGLAELQHRVYDDRPRETLEEIIPHPVTYVPLHANKADQSGQLEAVLYDCDGRAANEILTHRQMLSEQKTRLAQAILLADALVLVVDASAGPEQIDSDIGEFIKFLRLLEENRGHRSDIGGLPVFLVLSKCDLLAHPGDTTAAWQARIDERKKLFQQRFQEFLESEEEDLGGFGTIELHVFATAVKRPALAGSPAQPREPFGVAELFRDALLQAGDYRHRTRRSQKRLLAIVLGVAVLFCALAGTGLALYVTRPTAAQTPLAASVEDYRSREGQTPSARLSGSVQNRINQLSEIRQHPDFDRLPPELREYVDNRLQELLAYRDYRDRLNQLRPLTEIRSDEELAQWETRLRDQLLPPQEYQQEWRQTDAALLRQKWLEDAAGLHLGINQVVEWYRELRVQGERLFLFTDARGDRVVIPWVNWHKAVEDLFAKSRKVPFRPEDKLPNSRSIPAAPALTYEAVFQFGTVEAARKQWEQVSRQIERLREISTALGLAGDVLDKVAPLLIADKPAFRMEQVSARLAILKEKYSDYASWSRADIPDAVAAEIRTAAEASYQHLLPAGQQVVLRELTRIGDGKETPARWQQVADWAPTSTELQDWQALAMVLLRLAENKPEEPVAVLAKFLKTTEFSLNLANVRLQIPDDLKTGLQPAGKLSVYLKSGDATTTLTFRKERSEHDARGRLTTYEFIPEGMTTLTFHPGDTLWADLPLRDAANTAWKFTWSQCRSRVYEFERLTRSPRLHREDQDSAMGELIEAAGLVIPGFPRVPDLLPVVK
jgi:GTPase SAR1 family protein